jgi:hypothetical protein
VRADLNALDLRDGRIVAIFHHRLEERIADFFQFSCMRWIRCVEWYEHGVGRISIPMRRLSEVLQPEYESSDDDVTLSDVRCVMLETASRHAAMHAPLCRECELTPVRVDPPQPDDVVLHSRPVQLAQL